jgi:hypothetical protein
MPNNHCRLIMAASTVIATGALAALGPTATKSPRS